MDTATRIGRLIGPLRRAVLRTRRFDEALPDLPEAQIELLRTLAEDGPATPREVAGRLRIAPSTVSNLVRAMTASGLVERTPSATDLRTVRLAATPRALDLLGRYDRVSTGALRQALDDLAPESREALERALPVFAELLTALEARTLGPAPESGRTGTRAPRLLGDSVAE
ncbi:MarR family transcriptional regulator [Streptomyces albus subsp. chlorinus]|uniref:MarR family winged helix-turn-helix transcriptional regulator n=1 Tax=Streptomyces albus TaxID=1888 RepID=UPI00156E2191|nr:MarR family transcriptional regulator [Streptomyces albus]NSC21971.1 MarR family transcriptional regulator [Streptomyces albus subsp. chlorinus]